MTVVDFEIAPGAVGVVRVQERTDSLRTALPGVLMGGNHTFALGIPEFDARFRGYASNVGRARRLLEDHSLVHALLALPRGADIHIESGRCSVAVDGFPDSVEFVDRLVGVSEMLMRSLDSDPPRA